METSGVASIMIMPDTSGRNCEHAMTQNGNVLVDVRVCAPNVGTKGSTLARDIAQDITG